MDGDDHRGMRYHRARRRARIVCYVYDVGRIRAAVREPARGQSVLRIPGRRRLRVRQLLDLYGFSQVAPDLHQPRRVFGRILSVAGGRAHARRVEGSAHEPVRHVRGLEAFVHNLLRHTQKPGGAVLSDRQLRSVQRRGRRGYDDVLYLRYLRRKARRSDGQRDVPHRVRHRRYDHALRSLRGGYRPRLYRDLPRPYDARRGRRRLYVYRQRHI